jgi:hypothetical protein
MHAPRELVFDLLQLRTHPFRDRDPLDPEPSAPGSRADVREAQEVEGLRLAEPACIPVPGGVPPELDQPRVSSRTGNGRRARKAHRRGHRHHVVYDNGGTATFSSSQLALRRHGVHAFYGNLMGVPTLQPTDLPASILLTYPQVFDHVPDQDSLRARVSDVFDLVVNGDLTPSIVRRYGLADAPQAHRDLASRRTTSKLLVLP